MVAPQAGAGDMPGAQNGSANGSAASGATKGAPSANGHVLLGHLTPRARREFLVRRHPELEPKEIFHPFAKTESDDIGKWMMFLMAAQTFVGTQLVTFRWTDPWTLAWEGLLLLTVGASLQYMLVASLAQFTYCTRRQLNRLWRKSLLQATAMALGSGFGHVFCIRYEHQADTWEKNDTNTEVPKDPLAKESVLVRLGPPGRLLYLLTFPVRYLRRWMGRAPWDVENLLTHLLLPLPLGLAVHHYAEPVAVWMTAGRWTQPLPGLFGPASAFVYNFVCTVIMLTLHPAVMHFLTEDLFPDVSYYGSWNEQTFNGGYRAERRDFPRAPPSVLPLAHAAGAEVYAARPSFRSLNAAFAQFLLQGRLEPKAQSAVGMVGHMKRVKSFLLFACHTIEHCAASEVNADFDDDVFQNKAEGEGDEKKTD